MVLTKSSAVLQRIPGCVCYVAAVFNGDGKFAGIAVLNAFVLQFPLWDYVGFNNITRRLSLSAFEY
jgi:hypothetical protein